MNESEVTWVLDPRVTTVLLIWFGSVILAVALMLGFGRKAASCKDASSEASSSPSGKDASSEASSSPSGKDASSEASSSPSGKDASGKDACVPHASFWAKFGSFLVINLTFFFISWADYQIFVCGMGVLAFLATWEVASCSTWCTRGTGVFAHPIWFALSTAVMAFTYAFNDPNLSFKVLVILALLHSMLDSFAGAFEYLTHRAAISAMAVLYVPICLICLIYLKLIDPSGFIIIFLYLVIGATDAFAQITGRLVGKRKLAPTISPNKTIEGAIGGLAAALIIGLLARDCLPLTPLPWVALVAVYVSLVAVVGDLIMSTWKRVLRIKDFARTLGAHGGVTDRFDSLMLAAAALFIVLSFVPPHSMDSKSGSPTIPVLRYFQTSCNEAAPAEPDLTIPQAQQNDPRGQWHRD